MIIPLIQRIQYRYSVRIYYKRNGCENYLDHKLAIHSIHRHIPHTFLLQRLPCSHILHCHCKHQDYQMFHQFHSHKLEKQKIKNTVSVNIFSRIIIPLLQRIQHAPVFKVYSNEFIILLTY